MSKIEVSRSHPAFYSRHCLYNLCTVLNGIKLFKLLYNLCTVLNGIKLFKLQVLQVITTAGIPVVLLSGHEASQQKRDPTVVISVPKHLLD